MIPRLMLQPALPPIACAELVLEERVEAPARIEACLVDDRAGAWGADPLLVGRALRVEVGQTTLFDGVVWGRRMRRFVPQPTAPGLPSYTHAGSRTVIWASDWSQGLRAGRTSRGFAERDLAEIARTVCAGHQDRLRVSEAVGRLGSGRGQIVQYHESDFDFLARLAMLCGGDLWASRGELWLGSAPGAAAAVLDVDVSGGGPVHDWVVEESWADDVEGLRLTTAGVPFPGNQPGQDEAVSELLPGRDWAPQAVFERLLTGRVAMTPGGLVSGGSEAQALAGRWIERRSRRRVAGALHWRGPLPDHILLGHTVRLVAGKTEIARGVIMGIRRRWLAGGERDGAWDAVVSLGRPGPHVESDRDLYPARHLWMAWSTGTYEPARGTVGVKLAGWHPASDPLRARILSDSANEAASSVRCPQTGELGVVGFENGNPDAPVWLGAVHDREAPAGAAADRFLWMLNLADGGTVSVGVADGALEIRLAKLKLKVETDAALSLQAEELDVQAKGKMTGRGETLGFEADSAVTLKGKDVSIAASKVGVEKG